MGVYDEHRWQWMDDHYGPMGWFTDAEKDKHEGTEEFAQGHFRPLTPEERDSMNRWHARLASEQA